MAGVIQRAPAGKVFPRQFALNVCLQLRLGLNHLAELVNSLCSRYFWAAWAVIVFPVERVAPFRRASDVDGVFRHSPTSSPLALNSFREGGHWVRW